MRISDLPTTERPRERLATQGANALADRELLAMLLGTGGSRGSGAHNLAEQLLNRFGSVCQLARAHPSDLAEVPGVGPAKASALVSAFELARRAERPLQAPMIKRTKDLLAVVKPLLRGRTRERLVLVVCDASQTVTHCEVLAEGSADRAIMPLRDIAVAVLRRDSQTFALAHNHPNGDPEPSESDIQATLRLEEIGKSLGLLLLDHVVVTDKDWRRVPMAADNL